MRHNYYLRTSMKEGRAPLYLRIRKRSPHVDMYVSTRVEVNIETWKEVTRTPQKLENYLSGRGHGGEGAAIWEQLAKVKKAVESLVMQDVYDRKRLEKAVEDVVYAPQREAERKRREEEERLLHEQTPIHFLERFISEADQGQRHSVKGTIYTKGSVKCFRALLWFISEIP